MGSVQKALMSRSGISFATAGSLTAISVREKTYLHAGENQDAD